MRERVEGGTGAKGRDRRRRSRRMVAVAVGLAAALFLAEGALRIRFHALPSLDALASAQLAFQFEMPGGDRECPAELAWTGQPRVRSAVGADPVIRVWFAGDSTTAAVGVLDEDSWWLRVATGLAGGRALQATNLAVPGAEYCGIREQVRRRAAEVPPPDLLFVGVYADDLIVHQILSVEGKPVLLPSAAPAWLRPLVSGSYLANLVWMTVEPSRTLAHERTVDAGAVPRFKASTSDLATWADGVGARVAFVVFPPSGLHECPDDPLPDHDCARLPADLERMAAALREDGRTVLDTRPWFAAHAVPPLPTDGELVRQGRLQIPIHVATEGQGPLGDEVLRLAAAAGFADR